MKMIFKYFVLSITVLAFSEILHSQNQPTYSEITSNDSLQFNNNIPELNVFIDSFQKNSPILKATDLQLEQILEKIKKEKKSWSDYIFFDANARYGLFNTLTLSSLTSTSTTDLATQTDKSQLNYYAGITVRLPVSLLVSKQNDIKVLKDNFTETKYRREQIKNELTQLVIEEYYKLLTYSKSVQLNQNILESFRLNYLKAQKDISNGVIGLIEFNAALTGKEKAELDYYKLLNDYLSQYYKIQVLTGLKLNSKK